MRFRARQRLRANQDFLFVRSTGRRYSFSGFLGQAAINKNEISARRLGLKVSKKVGNAVIRNRMKRMFRELFRLHQTILPDRCDLVIVAHPALPARKHKLIQDDFRKLCELIKSKADI